MRVLALTTQVPFVRGGAELLAEGLVRSIEAAGHEAELVSIPFKWYPAERVLDQMLICRLFDLTEACGDKIDRVIGLKFPTYLIPHPNKVLWLVHQHRTAYDLWDSPYGDLIKMPNGPQVRQAITNADSQAFNECRSIYTIAGNVSKRLKQFNNVDSAPIYSPPFGAEDFYCEAAEDFFFFPSRLNIMKRQQLVIEALAQTKSPVKVVFAGKSDDDATRNGLKNLVRQLQLESRVTFLDAISETEKLSRYAKSIAVVYPPLDEDYGYVTLEAMLASKPVITCHDSGGSLEFVLNETTGLISEPTPESLAIAMDTLWDDRATAKQLGQSGYDRYMSMNISWANVVQKLLA
ncbi:glycosyltransferase family 4 protein [filamentous cyanobacterium LEGE 11480]|uniref:Glycosyltransferase family 4 protein n=1 Tax=Romeriopsis navalis LEGE 11480 TaxID=2777977 RepID=A0A928Z4P4_9CYAN|nr:glycosyltransferase family 4 protein [Romeriopsis navalis]MBE9032836.1 glycosyltransferase family 4 protein [Romeriopsis navalis LEGE 11480]